MKVTWIRKEEKERHCHPFSRRTLRVSKRVTCHVMMQHSARCFASASLSPCCFNKHSPKRDNFIQGAFRQRQLPSQGAAAR